MAVWQYKVYAPVLFTNKISNAISYIVYVLVILTMFFYPSTFIAAVYGIFDRNIYFKQRKLIKFTLLYNKHKEITSALNGYFMNINV